MRRGSIAQHLGNKLDLFRVELARDIRRELRRAVSAFDDLKAAVTASDAANEATMTTIATYLQDIAGQVSGGLSETDAAELAADLSDHAAQLTAAAATLAAADPGAPPADGDTEPAPAE